MVPQNCYIEKFSKSPAYDFDKVTKESWKGSSDVPFVTRWCRGKGGDVIIYVFRYIYSYHTGGTDLCYDELQRRALEVESHRRSRWSAVRTPIPWRYGKELKYEPRPDPTMRSSSLLAVRARTSRTSCIIKCINNAHNYPYYIINFG